MICGKLQHNSQSGRYGISYRKHRYAPILAGFGLATGKIQAVSIYFHNGDNTVNELDSVQFARQLAGWEM